MIIWHMLTEVTDHIWTRPALLARRFWAVELRAGLPAEHERRGLALDYNIPEKRAAECVRTEEAVHDYGLFASRWRIRPRRGRTPSAMKVSPMHSGAFQLHPYPLTGYSRSRI